jgi:hypothetical protein
MLAIVRNATYEFYQLGMRFKGSTMIPMKPENSISLDAGELRFVVEPRILDETVIATEADDDNDAGAIAESGDTGSGDAGSGPIFDDYGPSLHVFGARDGLEYLRFDCFAHKPHYHYARYSAGELLTVRIDQYAEGDPVEWTIGRLRSRLPEMLDYTGAEGLADYVREHEDDIGKVIDEIESLLRKANDDDLLKKAKASASA